MKWKITEHAKERLFERYGIQGNGLDALMDKVATRNFITANRQENNIYIIHVETGKQTVALVINARRLEIITATPICYYIENETYIKHLQKINEELVRENADTVLMAEKLYSKSIKKYIKLKYKTMRIKEMILNRIYNKIKGKTKPLPHQAKAAGNE